MNSAPKWSKMSDDEVEAEEKDDDEHDDDEEEDDEYGDGMRRDLARPDKILYFSSTCFSFLRYPRLC